MTTTTTIDIDALADRLTPAVAVAAWRAGNDAGAGFIPPDGDDAIEDVVTSYTDGDGGARILPRRTPDEVSVVQIDGRLIGIGGDSMGREAWCVDITDGVARALATP